MLGSYFSDKTGTGTRAFYGASACVVAIYTAVGLLAPLITPVCDIPLQQKPAKGRSLVQGLEGGLEDAPNPSYKPDPCRWTRYWVLLGMNKWEADMCTRVILSILMGSIIGFERRRVDRPAGIRTMAMVCLGGALRAWRARLTCPTLLAPLMRAPPNPARCLPARRASRRRRGSSSASLRRAPGGAACVFTIDSMFAFVDGTMGWDASRVSAASAPEEVQPPDGSRAGRRARSAPLPLPTSPAAVRERSPVGRGLPGRSLYLEGHPAQERGGRRTGSPSN